MDIVRFGPGCHWKAPNDPEPWMHKDVKRELQARIHRGGESTLLIGMLGRLAVCSCVGGNRWGGQGFVAWF